MSEPDDFARTLEQQRRANNAMSSGDPEPYMNLWSRKDPVSLFGAWGPCQRRAGMTSAVPCAGSGPGSPTAR